MKKIDYLFLIILLLTPAVWTKLVNANYYTTKQTFFLLAGGVSFLGLLFKEQILFPVTNKWIKVTLLFAALPYFIFPLILYDLTLFLNIAEPLAILGIFTLLYQYNIQTDDFLNRFKYPLQIIYLFIISVAFYDVYNLRILQDTKTTNFFIGSFGNVNMLAEFYVLSLPLVHRMTQTAKTSFIKLSSYLIHFSVIFIVLYSQSRSAWIGLFLWLVFNIFKNFNKSHFISAGLSIVLFLGLAMTPSKDDLTLTDKKNSTTERLSLYQSTLELIKDNPMGIGGGTFTNLIVPYRMNKQFVLTDMTYADQPHSEILKWIAQYGWVFIILIPILFFILIQKLYILKDYFLISVGLTLLPQVLFQFPFENPATVILLCLYFSFAALLFTHKVTIQTKKIFQSALIASSVLLTYTGITFFGSVFIESQYANDLKLTEMACTYYPLNIRPCMYSVNSANQQNNTFLSRQILKSSFEKFYLMSDYQRTTIAYFDKSGQTEKACQLVQVYQFVYPKQEFYNKKIIEMCQKAPTPFDFNLASDQFTIQYKNWLFSAI